MRGWWFQHKKNTNYDNKEEVNKIDTDCDNKILEYELK